MKTKTVLIIDDDTDVALSTAMMLRTQDYLPMTANSGTAGFKRAVETRPDVILLDLMLPDMSGWEFLKRRNMDPALALVPVIVVTGYGDVDEPLVGDRVSVMLKPVPPDQLLAKVRELTSIPNAEMKY